VTDIAIDARVLAVSGMAAVVTGIAFGLAPMVQGVAGVGEALRGNDRAETAPTRRQGLRGSFLVAEVALAVVLSVGALLFLTSFARVTGVDLGLDYRNVAVFEIRSGQQADARRLAALLDRVREIPGVDAAAISTVNVPFADTRRSYPIDIAGREASALSFGIGVASVSPDYFQALGMRLVTGRFFTDADGQGGAPIVVFNESAARHYFPNQSPISEVVTLLGGPRTIVGVVADVRHNGPEHLAELEAFVPLAQTKASSGTLFVKSVRPLVVASPQVKAAVRSEFPEVALPPPRTLEQDYARIIAERRFTMLVIGFFGVLAVTIAGVGIYGVMAYVVSQRTREIGIRKALGARSSALLWSVLGRASTQVVLGTSLGLGMSWFFATSVDRFLFSVQPREFWLYGAVLLLFVTTGVLAAYVPARRATRVDPAVTLRWE
jgi:predicted permease